MMIRPAGSVKSSALRASEIQAKRARAATQKRNIRDQLPALPTAVYWTLVLWVQEPQRRQGNWRNRRMIQRQFVGALFYAQRLKLIERQRTGQALPEPGDGTEGTISREKASDYNSVGLKNRPGWPQNAAMRPNPS